MCTVVLSFLPYTTGKQQLDEEMPQIRHFYFINRSQGEKIGSKLLSFATSDKGAKWLWVLEQNERGIKFYKKNGFDFTGERMIEDDWIPLKKMLIN